MKKKIIVTALTALFAGIINAQEIVTDPGHTSATAAGWAAQALSWGSQLEAMGNQLTQLKDTYNSLTGSRGMGNIMNDPSLRDYLPGDWQDVYDAVKSGGYEGLTGRAQNLYDNNKIFDSCAQFAVDDQRKICEAQAVKGAQDKAFALDAYDKAKGRLKQIDQLMTQIDETSDPKAIAELQGRIAAEQAMIENEQTKLQLYQMVAQAEDRIQQQRQTESNAIVLDNREYETHKLINLNDQQ